MKDRQRYNVESTDAVNGERIAAMERKAIKENGLSAGFQGNPRLAEH